jgi:DNA primase
LFFAKNAILSADNCFLVEGYTDVISLCQNGVKNVVASSGTSLTADQIRLIKRYTSNITILYDGDEAGLKASFRGIDLVLEQGMNVKVVLFPEGEDPDSFARKKRPAEIRDFLAENAKDFIKLKTGLLLEEVKDDPVKKAGLIKNVVGSISLIPDNITRSMYLKESAALMDIEEQTLVFELNKLLRSRYQAKIRQGQTEEPDFIEPVTEKTAQPYPQLNDHFFQESEIMRLLLLYGDELITFENLNEFERIEVYPVKISDFIMNDLRNDDIIFDHPVLQQIYNEMTDLQNRGEKSTSLQYFISHSNPEVMQMTIEIVSSKHELSENWKKNKIFVNSEDQQLKQIVTSSVLALKAKKINRILNDVRVKLKNAVSIDEQIELLQLNMQYKEIESQINQKLGRVITP